jgi:DNA-binding MarR family transcriptional regulator
VDEMLREASIFIAMTSAARRPIALAADEEAFWRAFLRALTVVPRALDADLMAAHGLSLTDYCGLMHLSEAPGGRLRMSDLAGRCALSLSGTTRIVNRLEDQGLLRREPSPTDGRSWDAVLTDAGSARLRRAWPAHLTSVRQHVMSHMSDLDLLGVAVAMSHFGTSYQLRSARP